MSAVDRGLRGKKAEDRSIVTLVDAVIQSGQSNAQGTDTDPNGGNNPPFGVPTSRVPFLRNAGAFVDANLQDLQKTVDPNTSTTYHSTELQIGVNLQNAIAADRTRAVAILKVAHGSTFVTDWIEGGGDNSRLQTAIALFKAQIQARYPNATIRWHWIWNQGETEALAVSQSAANAWAANFATLKTQVESYVSQTLRPHIIRIWHSLGGQNWLSTVRSQQATAATAASGYLIDVDATLDGNMQSDNVHYTGAGSNAVGALLAASILNDIAMH